MSGESPAGAPAVTTCGAELAVGGMTCASCAARVEKKLNKLGGVTAAVNFATATAAGDLPGHAQRGDLIYVVEQAGYTAALPAPRGQWARVAKQEDGAGKADMLRRRLLVSLALAIPVGAGDDSRAAVPGLAVGLAGAGLPGRAVGGVAIPPRRRSSTPGHGAATMDTLISVGVGRRIPVVTVRAIVGKGRPGGHADELCLAGPRQWGRRHLPGGRLRRDGADPASPLPRGPRQAALGRGAAGAAVAGRQGRRGAARRRRGTDPGGSSWQ